MATCSSSFRAICLGLALLAAKASADQRQPPALATLETLPMYSETSGDNEYDRGQEYILAMPPHGSQPSPPTATFETDGYTDGTQGEDRGSWKVAAIPTTSDSRGALFFDGAASELGNMYNAAVMRKFIEQQKPIETEQTSELGNMYHAAVMKKFLEQQKPFETEQTSELGNMYNTAVMKKFLEQQKPFETEQTSELGNMYNAAVMKKFLEQQKPFETEQTSELGNMYNAAVLRKFLGQQKPIMSKAYDVDPEVLLAKYLENQKFFGQQKPVVEVDSDAAFRHYFEQQKPIASQTYEVDSDGALRQYFEQQKPIVSQSYEVDSDAALRKYFEQQNPIVSQTYEVDSDAAFRKYFEQQQPIVSQTFEVDSDAALRKYFEQQKPIVSQTFDVDSTSAFRRYLEQQKPIVKTTEVLSDPIFKHSYSVQPVYNVKKYTQVQPVVHKSVTVLPPPIVRKLFKVLPTPVIRKYFTAPPVVQHVRESPSHVFNKFVKNVIVQHPQQRQDPFVVLPPSSKNVYNLIKLAAPTPKPTIPESTTPEPITEAPTTVAPTTTSPLPLKAEALVAQKDEAEEEEEVTEEQKLKSVGKMVVVETVRRVVDVPEFDGPAPPPARSEETVVEPDGTVRKFEKYIEYDQVSGNQQAAAGVRATHSKKQSSSKSGYAAQVSPVLVDAAKTATAASPGTARLLHSATFSGPAALQGSPAFLLGGGSSSFDSLTRTQFAKALSQPIHVKEAAASLAPEEALSQQRTDAVPLEQEHHELPSEMVEHWTTEPPALPKEAATVPPFA